MGLAWRPMAGDGPLDAFDPRFRESDGTEVDDVDRRRALVESRGPGPSQGDPKVRILRVAVPLLFAAGIGVLVLVFLSGLNPGDTAVVVGPERDVRTAVAERPYRFCYNGNNPCAWLTIVNDQVVAFNTSGPLPQEFGRQGVGWCASSGYFGANSTGSVWDQDGRIVQGPARRSLDRFSTVVDDAGDLVVNFGSRNAGLADWQVDGDVRDPDGALCDQIPFDRDPDLVLDGETVPLSRER
ncbi:hypothetical protein BH23ACT9_BH23ACT9_00540 [soil metagenome]